MNRDDYTEETRRTLPLMEGRTIEKIFTTGSFTRGLAKEVTGLTIRFTDGAEVTIDSEQPDPGLADTVINIARARGLYNPQRPREATDWTGKVVELS